MFARCPRLTSQPRRAPPVTPELTSLPSLPLVLAGEAHVELERAHGVLRSDGGTLEKVNGTGDPCARHRSGVLAMAFLHVCWPSNFSDDPRTPLESEFRETPAEDLRNATSIEDKDGLDVHVRFLFVDWYDPCVQQGAVVCEIGRWEVSLRRRMDGWMDGVPCGADVWNFGPLYREACNIST